jgi:hypothetical protein
VDETYVKVKALASVSRSALSAGTATTTVVYNVPLTITAGGPIQMDAATVAVWDELDPLTQATAVFEAQLRCWIGGHGEPW